MAASFVAELVERNKSVAAKHQAIPTFAELGEMGVDVPHVLIVTCLDQRCQPEYFLDLKPEDASKVVVMRNICGHVKPTLNDIIALDSFVGLKEIMIIHHTNCGSTIFTNDMIREALKKRLPARTEVDSMTFGAIDNLEQSIRDEIAVLRASPLVRKELADATSGFLYDLKTGSLTPVKA